MLRGLRPLRTPTARYTTPVESSWSIESEPASPSNRVCLIKVQLRGISTRRASFAIPYRRLDLRGLILESGWSLNVPSVGHHCPGTVCFRLQPSWSSTAMWIPTDLCRGDGNLMRWDTHSYREAHLGWKVWKGGNLASCCMVSAPRVRWDSLTYPNTLVICDVTHALWCVEHKFGTKNRTGQTGLRAVGLVPQDAFEQERQIGIRHKGSKKLVPEIIPRTIRAFTFGLTCIVKERSGILLCISLTHRPQKWEPLDKLADRIRKQEVSFICTRGFSRSSLYLGAIFRRVGSEDRPLHKGHTEVLFQRRWTYRVK